MNCTRSIYYHSPKWPSIILHTELSNTMYCTFDLGHTSLFLLMFPPQQYAIYIQEQLWNMST